MNYKKRLEQLKGPARNFVNESSVVCHFQASTLVGRLQQELDAMTARCAELKDYIHEALQTNTDSFMPVNEMLARGPAQSLAKVKAQAIRELIKEKGFPADVGGVCWNMIHTDDAEQYANELVS